MEGELVVKYDMEKDLVSMPLWYWKELVLYIGVTQSMME